MNRPFENNHDFQKKLHYFRSITDLYFKILNLLYFTKESPWYYCFCGLYSGCSNNRYYNGYNCCKLCQMDNFYYNFKKNVPKIRRNRVTLTKFAFELFEDIMECVRVDRSTNEIFCGEYSFYHRERDNLPLKDYIKYLHDNSIEHL